MLQTPSSPPCAAKEADTRLRLRDGRRGLIERELGWRPTIAIDAGLRQTLDWYRAAHR
jgi:dTDP-D-glucose 4,6-dehydratase